MNERISDELLAAYLDGNTSPIENLFVEASLNNDAGILEASDILSDMTMFSQIDNFNDVFSDFGLSDIFSQSISIETNTYNEVMDTNGMIPDIQQQYPDSCAIKSQQIILNEFGIDVNEDQLVQFSYEQGWYNADGTGTAAGDVGNLLDPCDASRRCQCIQSCFRTFSGS